MFCCKSLKLQFVLLISTFVKFLLKILNLNFMHSKLIPVKMSLFVFFASIILFSCKKNTESNSQNGDVSPAIAVANDNQVSSQQFNDVFNISMGVQSSDAGQDIGIGTGAGIVYRNEGSQNTQGDRCYTVTVSSLEKDVWPKTVTIDFGNGCTGQDGKVRKGKIISVFTNPIFMPGAKISISFDGYAVDSFAVAGTLAVTNTSTGNQFGFKEEVIGGKLTNTNTGFWHEYACTYNLAQSEGMSTPLNPLDDAYTITGNSQGGNSSGFAWSAEVTTPITRTFTCLYNVSGVFTFHWNLNSNTATLDYGNGTCDDKATVSYNGFSKVITL